VLNDGIEGAVLISNRKINPSRIFAICGATRRPRLVPRPRDIGEDGGESGTTPEAVAARAESVRTRDQSRLG
jgi:hypothetical protein